MIYCAVRVIIKTKINDKEVLDFIMRAENFNMKKSFEPKVFKNGGYELPYRFYLPENYNTAGKYPLLLFLHGAGERGCDNERQIEVGIQKMFASPDSPVFGAVVIAPQCPEGRQWVNTPWEMGNYSTVATDESTEMKSVVALLLQTIGEYAVDTDRVYITGVSMGGYGTWDIISRHGELFAAAVPVCGAGDIDCAPRLRDMPIMTYHGSADTTVPVEGTRAMVDAIKAACGVSCAARITYHELAMCGHGIWDMVYSSSVMAHWLFSQVRGDR